MTKLEIYYVTNKRLKSIENSSYNLSWVFTDKL